MKFCKDCVHFMPRILDARCESRDVGAAELPLTFAVYGIAFQACTVARQAGHACGPEAKYFVERDPALDGLVAGMRRIIFRRF